MELFKVEKCYGNKGCPNSVVNTEELIQEIENIASQERIEEFIRSKIKGPVRMHHCFKVGIANCPNACSHVQIKDFGIIAKVRIHIEEDLCNLCGKCVKACAEQALYIEDKKLIFNKEKCIGCGVCVKVCKEKAIKIIDKGFQVVAGGKLGRHPMLAIELSQFTNKDGVIELFKKIINFYKQNAKNGERLGTIMQFKMKNKKILNF